MSVSPSTPPALGSGLAWRNAVFLLFFLNGLGIAVWMARLPSIRDDLGVRVDQMGLLVLGLAIGAVSGLLVSGPLLARLGARRSLITGMIAVGLGVALVGVGSSFLHNAGVVFGALLLLGIGNGAADVVMNVEGADAERLHGRTLMPRLHAGFSLGGVAGALGGAGTSALDWSVAAFFLPVAALIAIVGVAAVHWIPRRTELADATGGPAPRWTERMRANLRVWRDPRLLLIGLTLLGFAFAEGSASDWLALAAVDGHGFDNTGGAIVFGLFVGVMTVLRFFGGPLLDRFGRVVVLRVGAIVALVGVLVFLLVPNQATAIVAVVLWAAGTALGFPTSISAAADGPNSAQRVTAAAMMGYTAFLVGPPLLGFIGEHAGILTAFVPVVALLAIAAVTVSALRDRPANTTEPHAVG